MAVAVIDKSYPRMQLPGNLSGFYPRTIARQGLSALECRAGIWLHRKYGKCVGWLTLPRAGGRE
jgi:hypothetical protein